MTERDYESEIASLGSRLLKQADTIRGYQRRVAELLEANNRYLLEARDARRTEREKIAAALGLRLSNGDAENPE